MSGLDTLCPTERPHRMRLVCKKETVREAHTHIAPPWAVMHIANTSVICHHSAS